MRFTPPTALPFIFAFAFAFVASAAVAAPSPEWKDAKGATFRGDPVEALGPLLMFRTGAVSSKFLPMHLFAPDDCGRFYQAIANRPPRADRWSDAKGQASAECIGRLQQSEKGQLRGFDFAKAPEPELILGLFAGKRQTDDEPAHYLIDNLAPFVSRVQRVYPGRLATIVWGSRDSHLNLKSLPGARSWLVLDTGKAVGAKILTRFIPRDGFMMVLMTREGVPLHGGPANSFRDVTRFVDGASDILWELNPANPRGARDRLHYLQAVRPLQFATDKAEPMLLIDPLKVDALRQRGVSRVEADFAVGPDGRPTAFELLPTSEIPAPLVPAVTEALRRNTIFLPAIDHGAPVAAQHHYTLKVEPADPKLAADFAWVNGDARVDVPFKSWLILKSIKVPEQVFSMVQGVGADGTVMLSAVTAGDPTKISNKSQLNAFNSDWFTPTGGPASVHPTAGEKQEVFGDNFTWKNIKPEDGLVDFLGGASIGSLDYCVGYAWTEVEMKDDTDAWLGFGSDDGVKVWVNGDLVNDQWIQRTSRLDDEVIPLRLKKGKNAFLVKIQNVRGRWSFTARLRVRGA